MYGAIFNMKGKHTLKWSMADWAMRDVKWTIWYGKYAAFGVNKMEELYQNINIISSINLCRNKAVDEKWY